MIFDQNADNITYYAEFRHLAKWILKNIKVYYNYIVDKIEQLCSSNCSFGLDYIGHSFFVSEMVVI